LPFENIIIFDLLPPPSPYRICLPQLHPLYSLLEMQARVLEDAGKVDAFI